MRLTSTLHAAGAALGLLAGLSMNHPVDAAPLAGEVTPYEVAVVWKRSPASFPKAPAAPVQVDAWDSRLPPPPAAKPSAAKPSAEPERAPVGRRAPKAARASVKQLAEHAPAPPVLRGTELASATSAVNRDECTRDRLARLAVESARGAAATES